MNVRLALEDHVATVTLSRPDSLNAVDSATANELQAIWIRLESDPEVRCIVLTGEGDRAFCAGADLKNPAATESTTGRTQLPAVSVVSPCAIRSTSPSLRASTATPSAAASR